MACSYTGSLFRCGCGAHSLGSLLCQSHLLDSQSPGVTLGGVGTVGKPHQARPRQKPGTHLLELKVRPATLDCPLLAVILRRAGIVMFPVVAFLQIKPNANECGAHVVEEEVKGPEPFSSPPSPPPVFHLQPNGFPQTPQVSTGSWKATLTATSSEFPASSQSPPSWRSLPACINSLRTGEPAACLCLPAPCT